jgi:hypothetical protein
LAARTRFSRFVFYIVARTCELLQHVLEDTAHRRHVLVAILQDVGAEGLREVELLNALENVCGETK